ncbi:hypothetical protein D3C72_1749620 [compost metagenome]
MPSIRADRNGLDRQVQAQHRVPVLESLGNGLVFGGAVQQLQRSRVARILALAQRSQGRQHGGLDALGRAAGEQQLSGGHAQHAASGSAHFVQQGAGLESAAVDAAGVAVGIAHHGHGGGAGLREHGGGGVGVEVDFHTQIVEHSPGHTYANSAVCGTIFGIKFQ